MNKPLGRRLQLVYAGWTLVTVAAIVAILLLFRFGAIQTQAERDAAVVLDRTLRPTLGSEAAKLQPMDLTGFTMKAQSLLTTQVRTIRLWSPGGRLLVSTVAGDAAAGDSDALADAAKGHLVSTKQSTPQGDVLVTYARLTSGAVLELRQDYGPIGESIAASRSELLISVLTGAALLFLLLQAALFATTHDLRQEHGRLLKLYQSGQAIRSSLDLSEVLEQLARDAAHYTHAHLGLATLVEEENDDLLLMASYDAVGDTGAHHHRKVEEWFLRRCAATGETVTGYLEQFPYRSLLGNEPELQRPLHFLCVPIIGRERTMGVLMEVRDKELRGFKKSEINMLEEMAGQAAMAVEQTSTFAKMRSYANQLELSYDSTLKVLMAALDAKDSGTQGHSERVSRLTVSVAREMGLSKEKLVDVERGALLHDIGKIGVSDDVLRKPEALTEKEWEEMQQHPLLAGLMISKVEFLEGALSILVYHHERYDGAGYPFGLQGQAIPLEARIFSVVDSFDAMTSDRPYRTAMPIADAIKEIQRNANIQFDPQVVEAFTRVMARMQPMDDKAA
ncbi:MAG: HD domain-containing phosphohydrolase [Dehalococcoidia bacterium]